MKTITSSVFMQSFLYLYNLDCNWLKTLYLQLLEIGSILRISNTFISRLNHINYTRPVSSKTEGANLTATICCALALKIVIFTGLHKPPTFGRALCRIKNTKSFACVKTIDAFSTPPIHFKDTVII